MNYYDGLVIEAMEVEEQYRAYITAAICDDIGSDENGDIGEYISIGYLPSSELFFEDAVEELRNLPYAVQTGVKHAYIARRLHLNVFRETKRAVRYANR